MRIPSLQLVMAVIYLAVLMSRELWDALFMYHLSADFERCGSSLQKKLRLSAGRHLVVRCSSLRKGQSWDLIPCLSGPQLAISCLSSSQGSSSWWVWGRSETWHADVLAHSRCLTDGRPLPSPYMHSFSAASSPLSRSFLLLLQELPPPCAQAKRKPETLPQTGCCKSH